MDRLFCSLKHDWRLHNGSESAAVFRRRSACQESDSHSHATCQTHRQDGWECVLVRGADARQLVAQFVEHYNHVRLHSAIRYITPADKLAGREQTIFDQRDQKLAAARERRAAQRREAPSSNACENGTQRKASGRAPTASGRWSGGNEPLVCVNASISAAQPLH